MAVSPCIFRLAEQKSIFNPTGRGPSDNGMILLPFFTSTKLPFALLNVAVTPFAISVTLLSSV